jgi:hypothetical protein
MSVYTLGILGLVLLAVAIVATWAVTKKKGILAGLTFALVAWLLPFAQLHSDDLVKVYSGVSGIEAGFTVLMWGRSVIFIFQLVLAVLLGWLWMKKEPIQPPETTRGK